jgi:hypothetical protein
MPLHGFVSTFYSSLIAFWESKALHVRWDGHWDSDAQHRHLGPDAHELGPWSLRSVTIEHFIEENHLKNASATIDSFL